MKELQLLQAKLKGVITDGVWIWLERKQKMGWEELGEKWTNSFQNFTFNFTGSSTGSNFVENFEILTCESYDVSCELYSTSWI
jgi:hypothetical protein